MTEPGYVHRKLVEVALPLDAINKASAEHMSLRHGHASTLCMSWTSSVLGEARAETRR